MQSVGRHSKNTSPVSIFKIFAIVPRLQFLRGQHETLRSLLFVCLLGFKGASTNRSFCAKESIGASVPIKYLSWNFDSSDLRSGQFSDQIIIR